MENQGRIHPNDVVAPEGTADVSVVLATIGEGERAPPSTSGSSEPITVLRQLEERLEVIEGNMVARIGRLEQTVTRNQGSEYPNTTD
jgi:hypothetical protein